MARAWTVVVTAAVFRDFARGLSLANLWTRRAPQRPSVVGREPTEIPTLRKVDRPELTAAGYEIQETIDLGRKLEFAVLAKGSPESWERLLELFEYSYPDELPEVPPTPHFIIAYFAHPTKNDLDDPRLVSQLVRAYDKLHLEREGLIPCVFFVEERPALEPFSVAMKTATTKKIMDQKGCCVFYLSHMWFRHRNGVFMRKELEESLAATQGALAAAETAATENEQRADVAETARDVAETALIATEAALTEETRARKAAEKELRELRAKLAEREASDDTSSALKE